MGHTYILRMWGTEAGGLRIRGKPGPVKKTVSKQRGGQWYTSIRIHIPVDEQILSRKNPKGNKGTYEILNVFGKQRGFSGLVAAFLSTDRQVDPERELILHSDIWREELVFLFPGDSRLTSKINKFSCKGWGGGSDSSSACHKSVSNGIQNPTPM